MNQNMSFSHMHHRQFGSIQEQERLASIDPMRQPCYQATRVVVKVGTSVVTRSKDQRLALGRLGALVESLEYLVRDGKQVILVTSGATAVGRQKLRFQQVLNSSPLEMQISGLSSLQARAAAAAGQSGLMALYDSMFQMMDMQCSQFLVTSRDFKNEDFIKNLNLTVDQLLEMNVVPVINENDSISSPDASESVFTDNDGLAAKLALQLKADLVVLMTDVDGVYTGPPDHPDSKLIDVWCPSIHDDMIKIGEKSTHGRGGMASKISAAWYGAQDGATVVIMNGKHPENLVRIIDGEKVGTLFNHRFAEALQITHDQANSVEAATNGVPLTSTTSGPEEMARAAREQSRTLAALPSDERSAILLRIADALEARVDEVMAANACDMAAATGKIDNHLLQRLALKPQKITQLADGIRQLAQLDEPIGSLISKMEIAQDLVLSKVTSPIGVVLIIFEARPDALPQIAALAIRSGNGLLLKGGKEATHSNTCLHAIITSCLQPACSPELIGLVTSRSEIDELLNLKEYIDLVVPRGSNQLVSYIQNHTSIPVLGHADGICHIYLDKNVDLEQACKICVDAKTDYPAACNAVEKVLVHRAHEASGGIFKLQSALRDAGVTVYGTDATTLLLGCPEAPSLRHEYGTPEVTIDLVDSMDEAIDKIHTLGSGHTEAICTTDDTVAEDFMRRVDSACVLKNCSTRFSDGFRFGLGAEVGISTSRIHARGPVGVEGLLTTRYLLRGTGQIVAKDKGVEYTHKQLPLE
eukprot:jgi/Ulvmu1/10361/UM061_0044.1